LKNIIDKKINILINVKYKNGCKFHKMLDSRANLPMKDERHILFMGGFVYALCYIGIHGSDE